MNKIIDLHMHTTVSDGTNPPEDMIRLAREAALSVFSVTDHDAVKGCRTVQRLLKAGDPAFICGVEFSCRDEFGQYHILGYAYDPESEIILGLVEKSHSNRMDKVRARLDFLREEFNFVFTDEELSELFSMENPGKPHIGNLMVKHGYARSRNEAIREYIDKLRITDKYLSPGDAIAGILASGGVPVLAHPFFGSGDQLIVGDEMVRRLRRLMDFGLQGVEAFYSGFSLKLINEMLFYAGMYRLYVTAGSDYHGTNKLIAMGDTGIEDGVPLVPGVKSFLKRVGI